MIKTTFRSIVFMETLWFQLGRTGSRASKGISERSTGGFCQGCWLPLLLGGFDRVQVRLLAWVVFSPEFGFGCRFGFCKCKCRELLPQVRFRVCS